MAATRGKTTTRAPTERDSAAAQTAAAPMLEGIKIFSSTTPDKRNTLGETATAWLTEQRGRIVIDGFKVMQSSDAEYHCVSILVFYRYHA